MVRAQAARINQDLPSGWALPRGWQAYAIFAFLPLWRLMIMLVAAAIAYRAMMTAPAVAPEPVGEASPAQPRRRALVPA